MNAGPEVLRALVIDDDVDGATSMQKVLAFHGYEAYACMQGQDGMEAIERLRPDILLLDLAMPGMGGLLIAEELLENPDLRPRLLIAVTGLDRESDRECTSTHGFDYHLVKPVAWPRLEAILKTVHLQESE